MWLNCLQLSQKNYFAYKTFWRTNSSESRQKIKQDLRRKNHFESSGVLSNYIMTSQGADELVLLDAWNNSEKCSWRGVIADFVLWIDPVHFWLKQSNHVIDAISLRRYIFWMSVLIEIFQNSFFFFFWLKPIHLYLRQFVFVF